MDVRVVSFECFGALVDGRAAVRAFVAKVLARPVPSEVARPDADAWLARWDRVRQKMLRPWRPYRELLARSFDATMQFFGLEAFVDDGPGLARALADAAPRDDASRALRRIARRHRLAIVSDADRELLAGVLGQLQAPFSSLVTAEDARAYKGDGKLLGLALERLGVAPGSLLHVGSVEDAAAARALGVHTAIIGDAGEAELVVPSLSALADQLGA